MTSPPNSDEVFTFLCESIEELVDVDPEQLTRDAVLAELELISLDYVELHVLVKKRYAAELGMEQLVSGEITTLGELTDYIVKYDAVLSSADKS